MRILTFDLETRLLASDLSPNRDMGWAALRRGEGGISALAIHDSLTGWVHLYDDLCIDAAALHLESADAVIGFASNTFDIPVIEGVLGRPLNLNFHCDLLEEIGREATARQIPRHRGDWTLDSICKRTLGRGKINHGGNVKDLISENRWAELFNYCCSDVELTYALFNFIRENGGVVTPNRDFMFVKLPDRLSAREEPQC